MFYETEDLRNSEIFLKLRETCDEQPEKRWKPAYYFDICLLDGTVIGKCDLRIGHNDKTYVGGNIGYSVQEQYRGNRYALKACELLFKQAKKHNMDHLIITCDPDNLASVKTIERAGGQFIEPARIPADNEMFNPETPDKCVKVYKVLL
ncbi:MAG: GNAT family N-acetyltransferase [Pusillimonas sp.]